MPTSSSTWPCPSCGDLHYLHNFVGDICGDCARSYR